jgi:hypothetical protein
MGRYTVEPASGFTRAMWRVRARLSDTSTGETVELRDKIKGLELASLLERADAGQLAPRPATASPFQSYETVAQGEWHYLLRADHSVVHVSFARTRSASLAQRAVDALNREYPRERRIASGPVKAGWF